MRANRGQIEDQKELSGHKNVKVKMHESTVCVCVCVCVFVCVCVCVCERERKVREREILCASVEADYYPKVVYENENSR